MQSKIMNTEAGIEIDVTEVEGKKDEVMEAFQECSEGRCTCQTQEYKKVESMEVIASDDSIHISIQSKPDEKIETSEIERCLEQTRKRVGG